MLLNGSPSASPNDDEYGLRLCMMVDVDVDYNIIFFELFVWCLLETSLSVCRGVTMDNVWAFCTLCSTNLVCVSWASYETAISDAMGYPLETHGQPIADAWYNTWLLRWFAGRFL